MGFFIAFILLYVFALSFFLDKIFHEIYPYQTALESFNRFILYYFLLDLIMRFQFQELPTLAIKPYLNLPVRRNVIVNYLCLSSLLSTFNFSSALISLPFLTKVVLSQYGGITFMAYVIVLAGLTVFNHFFIIWLKRKVNLNGWYLLSFLVLLVILFLLDNKFHIISITSFSGNLFRHLIVYPWFCLLTPLLGIGMFVINYLFLRSNLYLEELVPDKQVRDISANIPFLNRFGVAGELAAAELKLMFRNKRTKATLRICLMMLLYGLLFYTNPAHYANFGWKIFASMFMTGIFIINYGQFMYAWQSSHFDGLLVLKINARDFLSSKFLLFTIFSSAAFILTIPYVYFGWDILLVQFCMYLWNLGINTFIILWFANRNHKRIDLSKSASFNWEGVGATQFLISFPLLLSPFIIYLPIALAGYKLMGIVTIGVLGVVAIILRPFLLNILINKFNDSRYEISEGFRQK